MRVLDLSCYSWDRAGISTGKTKIMEVAGTDVAVTGAMLSDKAAKEIPVTFPGKKIRKKELLRTSIRLMKQS